MIIHVVKPGETAFSIANFYGVNPLKLISDNGLQTPSRLAVGQALVVQFPTVTHLVGAGESLWSIAQEYSTTVNQLYRNNPELNGLPNLNVGQTLVITYDQEKQDVISVNGYAYPFIDKALLRKTLPYLTYMTPFTYGITPEGGLVDLDDTELISMAKEYSVAPLMHLSTLTPEGNFSNELASVVLNNPSIQNTLINNVLQNLRQKGYSGLDIDFEFVFPQDRYKYVELIQNLTQRLNPEGYQVIAALAPKTSADQPGLFYEGHDYRGIGAAANAVLLMTYEWGYTYGPPMAVAPIDKVRAVLDYAVTEIPRDKIYLGIPNYGYDWTLPFVQGTSKAQSISNQRAVEIAVQFGVPIQYDEIAQTPHFQYYNQDGSLHEVWFEDARSIRAKLALIPEYGFLGAGYWNLMRPFPENWTLLNSLYQIRQ